MTAPSFRFSAILGFFAHEKGGADDPAWRATTLPNLGLIDREFESDASFDPAREKPAWERFENYVTHLNTNSADNTHYKLIYLARHGQGYHNVKEAQVGRLAWEKEWARLEGDGEMTWADSRLTPVGIQQARALNAFWKDALSTARIPAPQSYYSSPLTRCLETATHTFSGLDLPNDRPFSIKVKELLRERLGVHTCDRRSTKTQIAALFPAAVLEPSMSQQDELWRADVRESIEEQVERERRLLDDIFSTDSGTFVSFTVHAWTINALFAATGFPPTRVAAGAVVPLFVKAERS